MVDVPMYGKDVPNRFCLNGSNRNVSYGTYVIYGAHMRRIGYLILRHICIFLLRTLRTNCNAGNQSLHIIPEAITIGHVLRVVGDEYVDIGRKLDPFC